MIGGMIGQARLMASDYDEVDPALDDSIYTSLLNRHLLLHGLSIDRRIEEVTASDAGLTFTAGLKVVYATPTNWYEIVKAYLVNAVGDVYGTPLDIIPMAELAALQDQDTDDSGNVNRNTPTHAAFEAISVSDTGTGDSGRYNVRLWPVPDETVYVGVLVRSWKTELVDSQDIPDITPLGAYTIARQAAADAAALFGEDAEFIANILRTVPEELAAISRVRKERISRPTGIVRMVA